MAAGTNTNNQRMATMDTNTKGDISMACVVAELTKRGISVSVPYTDNKRYDLIMDYNSKLYRMQVKTILYKPENNGLMMFKTVSSNTTKTKGYYERRYRHGEIEGFLAYCIELDKVYLAWIGEVPLGRFSMRINEALNGQKQRIRYAHEYELDRKLSELDGSFTAVNKRGSVQR